MPRIREDRADRALFDQLARVHDADPVADPDHGAEVVADEQDRRVDALPEVPHEVEDRRLHRDVEAGGRLVHDEEGGLRDQRHRDDDPLLLAARELVRVAPEHRLRVWNLHLGEHPEGAAARLGLTDPVVGHRHLHELPAHGHDGVQARGRILVDHRDAAAPDTGQLGVPEGCQVLALEEDPPAQHAPGRAEIPHDRERHRRLSAAGLPDQPQRFSAAERQAQLRDDVELARTKEVRDPDVLELEEGRRARRGISHAGRSRAARSPTG
jgi:hypothetical protein